MSVDQCEEFGILARLVSTTMLAFLTIFDGTLGRLFYSEATFLKNRAHKPATSTVALCDRRIRPHIRVERVFGLYMLSSKKYFVLNASNGLRHDNNLTNSSE